MSWIGYLFWFALATSLIFTVIGIRFQSPAHLVIAAALSGLFSVAALFSIGIFILPLCLAQLALAWGMRRSQGRDRQTTASPSPSAR